MIENGFILTEAEAKEKMIKTRIVNRRSKKVLISPQVPNEQQYLERCRKAASDMLLGVRETSQGTKLHSIQLQDCLTFWVCDQKTSC